MCNIDFASVLNFQLVNFLPSTPVEIQLMIEESEERLSEQDIETLLHVISKYDK